VTQECNTTSEAARGVRRWEKISSGLRLLEKSLPSRYATCSSLSLVKPATYQLSHESAAVAHRMHSEEIEPVSIVLFVLLLSAFIAILTLRAHLRAQVGASAAASAVASAAMTAPSAPAATLIAEAS
jgi:hypothetical protein